MSAMTELAIFGIYLGMMWISTVVMIRTAPDQCPAGDQVAVCQRDHFTHVSRKDPKVSAGLSIAWPFMLLLALRTGFVKSAGVAGGVPLRPSRISDKELEAADKEVDDIGKELDQHMDEILEGKVVRPNRFPHQRDVGRKKSGGAGADYDYR